MDADPVEVAILGSKSLTWSLDLADAHLVAQDAVSVPEAAFGNSTVGSTFNGTYGWSIGHTGTLMGRFVGVLEGDCDRLYQAAFHYEAEDQASAEEFDTLAGPPPVPGS